jgi:hypothetical protein
MKRLASRVIDNLCSVLSTSLQRSYVYRAMVKLDCTSNGHGQQIALSGHSTVINRLEV